MIMYYFIFYLNLIRFYVLKRIDDFGVLSIVVVDVKIKYLGDNVF